MYNNYDTVSVPPTRMALVSSMAGSLGLGLKEKEEDGLLGSRSTGHSSTSSVIILTCYIHVYIHVRIYISYSFVTCMYTWTCTFHTHFWHACTHVYVHFIFTCNMHVHNIYNCTCTLMLYAWVIKMSRDGERKENMQTKLSICIYT